MKTFKVILSIFFLAFFLSAAAEIYAQVEDKPPATPTTPLAEAVKLYKAGLYQEAIDAFVPLGIKAKDRTERMKTQIYLGYTYFTIDNKEEAERAIKNGIAARQDAELNDKALFSEIDGFVLDFVKFFKGIKSATVGSVYIESVPSGAAVYIDNAKAGVTPLTRELAYQKYSLKFVKGGYSAKKMDLDFKKNDLGNIKMNLNEGRKHWKSFLQSALLMAGFSFLIGSI
jgi:tetratricopeptide (TPR) repeat protein